MIPTFTHKKEAIEWYQDNSTIRNKEKDTNGEVFTPISLVEEMLDVFPTSVWSNPDLTWLDPAAGYGQFMFFVVLRLMKGLRPKIPDSKKRLEHILKHQIYQIEFNKESANLLKNRFKYNVISCSFVEGSKYKKVFGKGRNMFEDGTTEFDIIIGNPPFNHTKKETVQGGVYNNLWYSFVDRADTIVRPGGYIGMIHNADWRSYSSQYSMIERVKKEYSIRYLHVYSVSQVEELFGVSLSVDLYVWNKVRDTKKGIMIDAKGKEKKINFRTSPYTYFIPSVHTPILRRIIKGPNSQNILYDSSSYHGSYIEKKNNRLRKKKTERGGYIYPVIHTVAKRQPMIHYTNSRDVGNDKNGYFGVPKIILYTMGDGLKRPYLDKDGRYGMGQLVFGLSWKPSIVTEKQLEKVVQSKSYHDVIEAIKIGRDYDKKIFTLMKPDWMKELLVKPSKNRIRLSRRKKLK